MDASDAEMHIQFFQKIQISYIFRHMDNNFLTGRVIRGIYRIYNLKTDRTYLAASEDIAKSAAAERFQLDLGMHSCRSLQEDYTTTGLELFVIEPVKEAGKEESLPSLLEKVKEELREKGITFYS